MMAGENRSDNDLRRKHGRHHTFYGVDIKD
jgi:hypothetical protein